MWKESRNVCHSDLTVVNILETKYYTYIHLRIQSANLIYILLRLRSFAYASSDWQRIYNSQGAPHGHQHPVQLWSFLYHLGRRFIQICLCILGGYSKIKCNLILGFSLQLWYIAMETTFWTNIELRCNPYEYPWIQILAGDHHVNTFIAGIIVLFVS